MNQNAISRLESPDYGKPTLTTLKRLAGAMDVALIVRLIPFSELIDWVSGTRRVDFGLSTQSLAVPSFAAEEEAGIFDTVAPVPPQRATVCNPLPRVSEERSGSNGIFGSSPQSIESPQKIYLMPSDRARNRDRQQAGPQSDNFSAAVGQL
jgi:hypothetical protein